MNFYRDIISSKRPVYEILSDENSFKELPGNWYIVVSDIANSTQAVLAGKHDDVNLVAAGCIIAALNVAKEKNIEIPYFFGGDGGIVLVPDELLPGVLAALHAHKINSLRNFSLDLRVGSVPMEEIIRSGHEVKLAKMEVGPYFMKPLLLGKGLLFAESLIKKRYKREEQMSSKNDTDIGALNLSGMECRWDMIKLPKNNLEVVCYLVEAIDAGKQPEVYTSVLKKLEEIYGGSDKRHPITINMLRFKAGFEKINREMKVKYAAFRSGYFLKTLYETLLAKIFFRFNLSTRNMKAKEYLSDIIACSEILTVDGRISTIVSGTQENRNLFLDFLYQQERAGKLYFGHYVSKASIMTCYVESIDKKHTHFVDGADGGYTQAARELKPKLRR